ncbi:hypothetical protein LCGC14_1089440 [marine sediment metagenome]|uniref:DNA methylase N-4/N-6 domain-containing protein n=1 Tax=marine sediment metagenome TaxID=412755 RepID=A0A0F9N0H3_9ZZZZ
MALSGALVRLEDVNRQVAAARTIADIKKAYDKIEALKRYAKSRAPKDLATQNDIAEAGVWAAWKGGRLLRATERNVGGRPRTKNPLDNQTGFSAPLSELGLSRFMSHRWQVISHCPEEWLREYLEDRRVAGRYITQSDVYRMGKTFLPDPSLAPVGTDYELIVAGIEGIADQIQPDSVDAIITDPPYNEESLPVYDSLSAVACYSLRPGGSCFVMTGQSYLPEVITRLGKHLRYHWAIAYLTPGGQAVQLWQRQVNTFWKPVLWFTKGEYDGQWTGDVVKSDVNDNDKRFHEWGQSESGMASLIEKFTEPDDLVFDPFLGGGTTAVAALARGRKFIGSDKEQDSIDTTLRRLEQMPTADEESKVA